MHTHTSHTRDAALRQLHRINRWLIAVSVVLTGVFAEAAAQAFPGRTTKVASASRAKRSRAHTRGSSHASTAGPLQPPARAPQATRESSAPQESAEPAQEATTTPESAPAQETATTQESTPAQQSPTQESTPAREPAPAAEPTPTHETAPAEEPAPVVSGGS
jgi:hypothetical protein